MTMWLRIFLVTSALALSGCTRSIETRINSAGQSNIEKSGFILAPLDKSASAELISARDLVSAQLAQRGFNPSETGPYYLEVGVSSRPASIAVQEAGKTIADASPKRPSRKCLLKEYRVAVALTRIADGETMYRASSGEFHCKAALANTLEPLVGHALVDFGQPRGSYVITTKAE
jgi:hypothetical protein